MHAPPAVTRAATGVRTRVMVVQAWASKTLVGQIWSRLCEDEFLDRSVALAAKAFVSAFPAIIVVASFMPTSVRSSILSTLARRLGVEGSGLQTIRAALASSDDIRKTTGVLGLIFTFYYVNSFVSALQRVYERAWRRPRPPVVTRYATGAAWLAALIAYFGLLGGARVFMSSAGTAAFAPVGLLATIAVWTVTPWLMLRRHVRLRAILPCGVVTGVAMAAYGASSSIWMPNTVSQNQHQFGFFGVTLALVTWLTGAATIVVVGAITGAVLAEDGGTLGSLIRGGSERSVLSEHAPERMG